MLVPHSPSPAFVSHPQDGRVTPSHIMLPAIPPSLCCRDITPARDIPNASIVMRPLYVC